MDITCISDLPSHHQLYVTHNGHNTNYESIQDYLDQRMDGVCSEELKLMIEADTIWEIQLYPITPIGFHWEAAATLKKAIQMMMLNYENGKWN